MGFANNKFSSTPCLEGFQALQCSTIEDDSTGLAVLGIGGLHRQQVSVEIHVNPSKAECLGSHPKASIHPQDNQTTKRFVGYL